MGRMPPLDRIDAVYTASHSFIYETFIAPALLNTTWTIDERLLRHLPQGASLLDVGLGGGLFTEHIAERRPDLRITGVDLSPAQLQRARRRLARFGDRVTIRLGDATRLDFADDSFDGVVSYGAIKHWSDRRGGVRECLRVLKPGGPLLITDAERGVHHDVANEFVSRWRSPRFMHDVSLGIYYTWVAGRSLDLADARAVVEGMPIGDLRVAHVPDSPIFEIAGRKLPPA